MMMSKKNGKIEFLRFVFCMAVLLFHSEKYIMGEPSLDNGYNLSLFCHGSMGVEFFFLLSGFFMAGSAYKKQQTGEAVSLAQDSLNFLKRKYLGVFPMHALALIPTFAAYVIVNRLSRLQTAAAAIQTIPNLFLVQMTGLGLCNPNHVTWYLSCMFIAMAILYPLCRKYYEMFTHYIAPVGAVLLLGYCMKVTGALTGVMVWTGVSYKSTIRAVLEIALGTTAFEISRYLAGREYRRSTRIWITIAEICVFACTMLYCVMTFPRKWQALELFALMILVILAGSQISCGSGLFQNRVCYHLGKLSLPLYLSQVCVIDIVTGFFSDWSCRSQVIAVVIGTFAVAYMVWGMDYLIRRLWRKRGHI
jgi:peptidoglycan/LPS O-acetylase OafA/YrhL